MQAVLLILVLVVAKHTINLRMYRINARALATAARNMATFRLLNPKKKQVEAGASVSQVI